MMRWHLYPESAGWGGANCHTPGYEYTSAISDWRTEGIHQYYARGDFPPRPHASDPTFLLRGDGRVRGPLPPPPSANPPAGHP